MSRARGALLALVLLPLMVPAQARAEELQSSPKLHFAVPHSFTREVARERVMQLLEYWKGRFGTRHSWDGDRVTVAGKVMGIDFQATLEVGDQQVGADATDPGYFLRGSANDYIRKKLRKYLHPRYEES
jgi:hypothetical protein